MDELLRAIRLFVQHKIAEGFDDESRVIDQAVALFANQEAYCPSYFDFLQGDETQRPEAEVRPHIEQITATLFDERRRVEVEWTEPTDCDRLDQAFTNLEAEGILARQNLLCCMTCARADVSNLLSASEKAGRPMVGFTFFHEQDTSNVPHGELFLAFGASDNDVKQTAEIGRRVVAALKLAGLRAHWNGDPNDRISVALKWRKRRFT